MAPTPKCGGCGTCAKCQYAAYMREWYRRPGNAEAQRESQRLSRLRRVESVREYDRRRGHRGSGGEKERAQRKAYKALLAGKITRGACEVGGDCQGRVEAHHDDYGRPLEVRWLCRRHHAAIHRKVA